MRTLTMIKDYYINNTVSIFVLMTLLILFLKFLFKSRKFEDGFGELIYTEERFNFSILIGIICSLGIILFYFILIKNNSASVMVISLIGAVLATVQLMLQSVKKVRLYEEGLLLRNAVVYWQDVVNVVWSKQREHDVLILSYLKRPLKYTSHVEIYVNEEDYDAVYKLIDRVFSKKENVL